MRKKTARQSDTRRRDVMIHIAAFGNDPIKRRMARILGAAMPFLALSALSSRNCRPHQADSGPSPAESEQSMGPREQREQSP